MSEVFGFIKDNWQFLLTVAGIIIGWFDLTEKVTKFLSQSKESYLASKKWAKSKDLYKAAHTAYGIVSKIAKKTENTIDDKAALGLEKALEIMRKLGWDKDDLGNGEADVILKVFDEIHEFEGFKKTEESPLE